VSVSPVHSFSPPDLAPPPSPPQCNGLMLVLFSRSLRYLTSLQASAASIATNIVMTGQLGRLVFGETVNVSWWIGASTIVIGTFFIKKQEGSSMPAAIKVTAGEKAKQAEGESTAVKAGATMRRKRRD
jgi:hypothetical protein